MYDADYANYLDELKAEAQDAGFVTKDSGERAEHPDGVVRDTDQGKPRFDLLFPKGVPFEDQLMTRVAELYERGGVKYGMRNWEKSNTEETLAHHEAALMRHVVRFLIGTEDGEDHAAAVVWNVNAVDLCRRKIKERRTALPGNPWTPWNNLPPGVNIMPCTTFGTTPVLNTVITNPDFLGYGGEQSEPITDKPDNSPITVRNGGGVLYPFIFPYVGPDTATTGKYGQLTINAPNYQIAQATFETWLEGRSDGTK